MERGGGRRRAPAQTKSYGYIDPMADPRALADADRGEGCAHVDTGDCRLGFEALLAKHKPRFKGKIENRQDYKPSFEPCH